MGQEGPASWELEAFPTSGAVDCHLSTLTDEHYGSPLNQLNLGHRTTMPVLAEAGGSGGRGRYTLPSTGGAARARSPLLGESRACKSLLGAGRKTRSIGEGVLKLEAYLLKPSLSF